MAFFSTHLPWVSLIINDLLLILILFLDEKRPNVYLSIEMTSGFLRVRHSGSTIYSKQRLAIDVNHTISVIIGHMVNIPALFRQSILIFI